MHLAAMSNTQMAVNDPWLCTQLNCVGTVNVLDGARNAGVERVVVAGSSLISAYQRGIWNEEHEEWQVNEASPIDPLGSHHPYVTSKVFEEMIARDFMRQYGLPVTVMRYGIQYGPRMTPGVVVHSFIERALRGENLIVHGTGEQWRQYIHVSDVAAAHVQVLERWDETDGLTLHIVTDRKVSILDLAHAVQKAVPGIGLEHGPERKGDIEVQWCDSTLTRSALDWDPRIELEEGVEHTVDWYRRHLSSGMKRR
jgi:UDP-glucose 4-epimerase